VKGDVGCCVIRFRAHGHVTEVVGRRGVARINGVEAVEEGVDVGVERLGRCARFPRQHGLALAVLTGPEGAAT
jgi:hypothetical protein